MEIEVGQANGVFLKAKVQKVSADGISVVYSNNWALPDFVAFDRCRVLPAKSSYSSSDFLKVDSIIEAYIKHPESKVCGWQRAKIRRIMDDCAVVYCIAGPTNSGVVSLKNCRRVGQAYPVKFEMYKTHSIDVPEDLSDYFDDPKTLNPLRENINGIDVKFVKGKKSSIVINSFSSHAIRCVQLVEETFVSNARQTKNLSDHLKSLKKPEWKKPGKYFEEFAIPDELIGMAIGKKGTNIANARAIPGITSIIMDQSRQVKSGICIFKISADTIEAMEKARGMVEFIYATVLVPKAFVGQVVGKAGKNMQKIVNMSGAIKVQIGCDEEEQKEGDQTNDVELILTGTRESLVAAKLMVELRIKHIKEVESLRASIAAKNTIFNQPTVKPQNVIEQKEEENIHETISVDD